MLTIKFNKVDVNALLLAAILACPLPGFSGVIEPADPAAIALRNALTKLYPNTKFGDVHRTPIAGVWEIWMGANVAYVTDEGRHFIFGHLYDMKTQTDLTATRQEQASLQVERQQVRLTFSDLPLQDAIKTVRGTGQRKLAVFSDPHCPYCQKLEQQLIKLDNVTIYTFLLPITNLHPTAIALAQSIWCADDRAKVWEHYMIGGQEPAKRVCDSPINRTAELANSAHINGTPFLLFGNGDSAAGAMSADLIEERLSNH